MNRFDIYIIREILKPLAAVLGLLIGLFACFSGARFLAEAVTETMGAAVMLKLVLLRTLIALEVLLPVALYVSVVIGLGRLHRDQEIIAMRAAGLGRAGVPNAVLRLAVPVGLVVGLLSLGARPWAYEASYLLDAEAHSEFNPERLQAGRFYGNEESGRVIYIQDKEGSAGPMRGTFIFRRKDASSGIILAAEARHRQPDPHRRAQLHLRDGYLFRFLHDGRADEVVRYEKLVLFLSEPEAAVGYKRKAVSTGALLAGDSPPEIAELQWRLSRPIATILLALAAVPLSRSTPRQGKHEKMVAAALVFAVYYNLSGLAQTWVEQGVIGGLPGVWWLHGLMFLAVIGALWPEYRDALPARK
ncbi:MAG: LPS export ABC transporter permease LptF [Gammaproteobacteria bacterium]|nr:LPS export ABC transporter permease LptF [Gammaproteobacteria bacterium]